MEPQRSVLPTGWRICRSTRAKAVRCMPSACLNYSVWLLLSGALLTACDREERRFREAAPASAAINSVALSDLQPGVTTPRVTASHPCDENAYAISEGKRLFE